MATIHEALASPETIPEADRFVPATRELLEDWSGPGRWYRRGGPGAGEWRQCLVGHPLGWAYNGTAIIDTQSGFPDRLKVVRVYYDDVQLDPSRFEVRALLRERLALPDWMFRLEPWVVAGLCACSAGRAGAGLNPVFDCIRTLWPCFDPTHRMNEDRRGQDGTALWVEQPSSIRLGDRPDGPWPWPWRVVRYQHQIAAGSAPTSDEAKRQAEVAALVHGCALFAMPNTLWLPYPDGVRAWRRTPQPQAVHPS